MLDNYLEGDILQSQSAVITALAIFLPLVITGYSSEKRVVKDSSYGMRMAMPCPTKWCVQVVYAPLMTFMFYSIRGA